MFCANCGERLPEGAAFCSNCGAKAQQNSGDMQCVNLIGFTPRCNSPEILETARKHRKSVIGCMWILVFLPLIGFPIAGLLMDDFPFGESVVVGAGIALVMLLINLFALYKSKQPIWEGTINTVKCVANTAAGRTAITQHTQNIRQS